jgi:hypothetical protein
MRSPSTLKVAALAGLGLSGARFVIWAIFGVSVLIWREGDMVLLADLPSLGVAVALERLGMVRLTGTYFDLGFLAVAQATWFLIGVLVAVATILVRHRCERSSAART